MPAAVAGRRLAVMLNRGEPAERATVVPAGALYVSAQGFAGNLAIAASRREWLKARWKVKEGAILSVGKVADASTELSIQALGRLVFVFGDELDVDGHGDRLEPAGLDEHLERYAKAIRRLSRAGCSNVLVTIDHGFFHWTSPENDFVPKPEGEIAWASRRCVIGSALRGVSTLELPVSRSELCARTPWSVNVFQTHGGLRYFHGGSTLQELVLPVLVAHWPKKAEKVAAVIRPVESITNIGQRLEAAPGVVQQTLGGGVSGSLLSRMVRFRVVHEDTGKALFRSETGTIAPEGGVVALALKKVEGAEAAFGSAVAIQLLDADDDEVLDTRRQCSGWSWKATGTDTLRDYLCYKYYRIIWTPPFATLTSRRTARRARWRFWKAEQLAML